MSFTRGPWEVIPEGNAKFILKGADSTYAGAILVAMTEEDISLIGAAPDLYDALEEIIVQLPWGELRAKAQKALTKAESKRLS